MQGLKLPESDKFIRFWMEIQKAAAEKNAVFYLDTGEGHDFETPEMEGEYLSGWLVPVERCEAFELGWKLGSDYVADEFDDVCLIAKWSFVDGNLVIRFAVDMVS
ncbi:MAG: hypothetical protein LBN36_07675 [Clostridiales Family XIII bacterium]|jgi:hypothetical protein|nr:hypothetical protein [Clostridiales Family XIII bacterium]